VCGWANVASKRRGDRASNGWVFSFHDERERERERVERTKGLFRGTVPLPVVHGVAEVHVWSDLWQFILVHCEERRHGDVLTSVPTVDVREILEPPSPGRVELHDKFVVLILRNELSYIWAGTQTDGWKEKRA